MARKNKYVPGPQLASLLAVVAAVEAGNYIYLNHKPQHPRVVSSMTMDTVRGFAIHGRARLALFNPENE